MSNQHEHEHDHEHDAWTGEETHEWLKSFLIWKTRRGLLERKFKNSKGWRVLEAGSGPAHDSLVFAEEGAEVTGLDISESALRVGQREYKKAGLELSVLTGDLAKIPAKDNSFDLVWNAGVLEHFEPGEDLAIVKEMARVTKPGGTVLIIVPNTYYFWYQISVRRASGRQYHYERSFSYFQLRRLMERADLVSLQASGDFVHPNPEFILPHSHRVSKLMERLFRPLERSRGFDYLKALMGLEVAVWGKKPKA